MESWSTGCDLSPALYRVTTGVYTPGGRGLDLAAIVLEVILRCSWGGFGRVAYESWREEAMILRHNEEAAVFVQFESPGRAKDLGEVQRDLVLVRRNPYAE